MGKNVLATEGIVTKYWPEEKYGKGIIEGSNTYNGKTTYYKIPFTVFGDKIKAIQEGEAFEMVGSFTMSSYQDKEGNWKESPSFIANKITGISKNDVQLPPRKNAVKKEDSPTEDAVTSDDEIPF